jgi:outer membrane protein assembly factor BamB
VGNDLYIGSCGGMYYLLDKMSGEVRWKYDFGAASFHGNAATIDSILVVPFDGETGAIYAFVRKEGELLWKFNPSKKPEGVTGVFTDLVTIDDHTLGVTTTDKLVCLDNSNGKLIWSFQSPLIPDRMYAGVGPVTQDSSVFFMAYTGWLHCLNYRTGDEMWKSYLGSYARTNIVIDDSDIFVGTADSTMFKIPVKMAKSSTE